MIDYCKISNLIIAVTVLTLTQITSVLAQPKPETDQDKTLYTFGYAIAKQWRSFGFSEAEINVMAKGIADSALDREPQVKLEDWADKIQPMLAERQNSVKAAIIKQQTAISAELLAREAKAPAAQTTSSGLIIRELKPGIGTSPSATSRVTVHYQGTLADGTVFDSSFQRGEPATFALNGVIKCWTEGLQRMKEGGKSRLVCPADIAYGENGAGSQIPPAAALIFEIELLKVH